MALCGVSAQNTPFDEALNRNHEVRRILPCVNSHERSEPNGETPADRMHMGVWWRRRC